MARRPASHADELLRAPAVGALSTPDRNLATALVMGVLRWQLALEAILAPFVRGGAPDEEVAVALRMGAWQLLGMDRIPPHAALSESVELARAAGFGHAAGMVNAVLRRVAEARPRLALDPAAAHPGWLLARWRRHYGADAATAIAAWDQQEPEPCLRIPPGSTVPDPAPSAAARAPSAAEGSAPEPGAFLTRAIRLRRGTSPAAGMAPVPGGLRLQDEGSQLVAEIAGQGRHILDCCAAPGGKTAILAANNPGAEITAVDVSRRRLEAMRRSLARDPATASVRCLLADATALPLRDDFDLILCDAPCSGTGTLARNPEIRLRLTGDDLTRQQARQRALLHSAFRLLARGGRLVYSTCSLEPEENAGVVESLLAAEPEARMLPVGERLQTMLAEASLHPAGMARLEQAAVHGPYLQTLPGLLPCDGFFAALITRGPGARG